ncbi:MAG TPA: M20 family metallopeptidase [Candidatus Limnocylindrales bacterium]|nr:M20 family metallopeptidase [Candidatus Limnocylindrales bacterium]
MTTESRSATLLDAAEALRPWILDVRRRLHRIPEVGLHIPKTQALVADEVRSLGLEPVLGRSTSSVTAVIEGRAGGAGADRTIVLRGDMDGLPLTEDTGLDFASEHPGAMHACGHDTHVAMLLGAARLLLDRRDAFAGRVVLMFQPGEEGYHGARFMLEDGLLEGIEGVPGAATFAIHISTRHRTGRLRLRNGPLLAAADRLLITVRGRGGHASEPFLALDPITIAAELIIALQLMVTRTVDALDPAVLTIARVTAGTTNNIIPPSAELEGTMRTLSETVRADVKDRIRRVAAGIAAAHGAEIDVVIEPGYPVTVNDGAFADLVRSVGAELAGADAVEDLPAPIMGAEDFSYVLQRLPGAMVFLGARPDDAPLDTTPQNHSNLVVFDESPLPLGAATYAGVALRHLAGG